MAVKNLRRQKANVWIPTDSNTVAKIIIKDDSDTLKTVMDTYSGDEDSNFTIDASVTKAATDKLGSFRMKLINDEGRFLNKYNGGESVYFFADTEDATTHIFHGTIDSVKYGVDTSHGFYIDISGREYPELIDKTITNIIASELADLALYNTLYEDFPNIQIQYWNGSLWLTSSYNPSGNGAVTWSGTTTGFPSTRINTTFQHQKGWNTITEICKYAGLDCYLDYDYYNSIWILKITTIGSITNLNVGVSYGINLLNLSEYGIDDADIYNRVIVYGKPDSDNILVMKSENDIESQNNLWIKDRIFNESTLDTMEEVASKATYEISNGVALSSGGRMTSLMLPNIRPGEKININVPYCNINGLYRIHGYTHTFNNEFTTTIDVSKKAANTADLFISKINSQELITSISNPNGMTDSYTIYFNEPTSKVTHVHTKEVDGKLMLQDGYLTGTVTAEVLTETYNVKQCELRRYVSNDYSNDIYKVTNQGGVAGTWEDYTELSAGDTHTFQTDGNRISISIQLVRENVTDPSPMYESIALLYK